MDLIRHLTHSALAMEFGGGGEVGMDVVDCSKRFGSSMVGRHLVFLHNSRYTRRAGGSHRCYPEKLPTVPWRIPKVIMIPPFLELASLFFHEYNATEKEIHSTHVVGSQALLSASSVHHGFHVTTRKKKKVGGGGRGEEERSRDLATQKNLL